LPVVSLRVGASGFSDKRGLLPPLKGYETSGID